MTRLPTCRFCGSRTCGFDGNPCPDELSESLALASRMMRQGADPEEDEAFEQAMRNAGQAPTKCVVCSLPLPLSRYRTCGASCAMYDPGHLIEEDKNMNPHVALWHLANAAAIVAFVGNNAQPVTIKVIGKLWDKELPRLRVSQPQATQNSHETRRLDTVWEGTIEEWRAALREAAQAPEYAGTMRAIGPCERAALQAAEGA